MKKQPNKIGPKEYSEILSNTELIEIYLESCSVRHNREEIQSEKKINISITDKVVFKKVEAGFTAIHTYDVKAVSSNPEKTKPMLNIKATFCLNFKCGVVVGKPFFDIFKVVNLPLNSWPYLREFVQNTVQRMNLPPLILPFSRRND